MPNEKLRDMMQRVQEETDNKNKQEQEREQKKEIMRETSGRDTASREAAGEKGPPVPCDAEPVITVSGDKMQAILRVISPKNGGKDVTAEMIYKALSASKVTYGIIDEIVMLAASELIYDKNLVVAKGLAPIPGENGSITPLVKISTSVMPKDRGDGTVDYRELGLVNAIRQDDKICEIIPPTMGVPGSNVFGDVLRAGDGKQVMIPKGAHVGFSEDNRFLVALCDGNISIKDKKYNIDQVFVVSGDVDLSTGNIKFPGDIIVKGNISEGFIVKAEGSITVNGTVSGGIVESGGNMLIKSGAVNARIVVKGEEFVVRFIENSTVFAKGTIKTDAILNSEVYCEKTIDALRKPGVVMGGEITAIGGLSALTIGSKSYIPTSVKSGSMTQTLDEKYSLEKAISVIDDEISRYTQVIDFLNSKKKQYGSLEQDKDELLGSSLRFRLQKMSEKKTIQRQIAELMSNLVDQQKTVIACKDTIYPGVKIAINNSSMLTNTEIKFCRLFENTDGTIHVGTFA